MARSWAAAFSVSRACMRASLVAARFSRLSRSSCRISSSLRARRTWTGTHSLLSQSLQLGNLQDIKLLAVAPHQPKHKFTVKAGLRLGDLVDGFLLFLKACLRPEEDSRHMDHREQTCVGVFSQLQQMCKAAQ